MFIGWVRLLGLHPPSGLFANFALHGHSCNVHYFSLRGATVSTIRIPAVRSQIVSYGADVVSHIGGNDLDGKSALTHVY